MNSEKIYRENIAYVKSIAKKFSYVPGIEFDDLVQEGSLGLLEAAKRFDESKNVKFLTYAAYYINKYIRQYVNKNISNTVEYNDKTYKKENTEEKTIITRSLLKFILDKVNDDEKTILYFYLQDYTLTNIGRITNKSCERIRQKYNNLCKKTKKKYNHITRRNGLWKD